MALVINTNIASLNAQRNLMGSANTLQTSLQRLSSGLRINSAKDDAAGLAIASRMSAQVSGLNQAVRNANDAVSLSQTAEGALSQSGDILTRIRDLAVQSANDTNSGTDRQALQQEVGQLQQELNRVANETEFNGKKLLDGTFAAEQFQVGANANQTISIDIGSAKATAIGNQTTAFDATTATAAMEVASGATGASKVTAAEVLTINGLKQGTANVAINSSASDIATAVNNQSETTGVTANARTEMNLSVGGFTTASTVSFNLSSVSNAGGSQLAAISVNVSNASDLSSVADAINAKSGQTGVSATASGGTVKLVSATGDDIKIDTFATTVAGANLQLTSGDYNKQYTPTVTAQVDATNTAAYVTGRVNFSASDSYSVTTDTAGPLFTATTGVSSTLDSVGKIDIGSQAGANDAISVIDGALNFVNGARAKLGAIENRVESTIKNLSTTSENLSAAKSRIEDTDFAAETAQLTRSQVLQQAGTAMLAQANALPNNVLALLRS
jgi:flagellin